MRPVKKTVKKIVAPAVPTKKTALTAAELQKIRNVSRGDAPPKQIPAKSQTASQIQALKAPLTTSDNSTPKKPGNSSGRMHTQQSATKRPTQNKRQQQPINDDSNSDYSDYDDNEPMEQSSSRKNQESGVGGAQVKQSTSKRKIEAFDAPHHIPRPKTAAEILAEKNKQLAKPTTNSEEHARVIEERLRAIEETNRLAGEGHRTVIKAKIISKKYERGEGDDEKNYDVNFEEEEMDSWEEPDLKSKPLPRIKEIDAREASKSVKNTLAIFSRKTDKVKVQGKDTEDYDVEDIIETKPSKKGEIKFPIITLDNVSKLINAKNMSKRKDILMVGLSESAKDSICELLMDTDLGKANRIFDTTLEENEELAIPKNAIAIFSEKVPILPLDERDEESEDEDGVKARARAKAKVEALKAIEKAKKSKRKVVKAEGENREEEHFNVKKDYPSVRFIFLVKVSASDRVNLKDLHSNVALFMPFEKFKKKFTELTRAECLIIDLDNKNQIYHMEF
jgi:hypothetical protein